MQILKDIRCIKVRMEEKHGEILKILFMMIMVYRLAGNLSLSLISQKVKTVCFVFMAMMKIALVYRNRIVLNQIANVIIVLQILTHWHPGFILGQIRDDPILLLIQFEMIVPAVVFLME